MAVGQGPSSAVDCATHLIVPHIQTFCIPIGVTNLRRKKRMEGLGCTMRSGSDTSARNMT